MKRHCSTAAACTTSTASSVYGYRSKPSRSPLRAVARAAQLDGELERLHERRRADHVVVVERAPAGVRVLVAEQPLGVQQRRVLGEVLAVHDQVLPVHVDLDVVIPRARSVWMTCSVMPMLPMWIFIAGSEFLCSSRRTWSCSASLLRGLADAVDEPRPALGVRRLEGVVVALDPGPDDHPRAEPAGEVGAPRRSGARPRRGSRRRARTARRGRSGCRGACRWRSRRCRGRRAPSRTSSRLSSQSSCG